MLRADTLLWLSSCLCIAVCSDPRLMGGEDTSIEQYPYMAGFEWWNWFVCASTIIHSTWALTAGHCVRGDEDAEEVWLRVGSTYRRSGGWTVPVFKVMKHENQMATDIALLFMEWEFPLGDTVKIIRLPEQGNDVEVGTPGTILGWGYQDPGTNSDSTLKKVEMNVVHRMLCQPGTPLPVDDAILCAKPQRAGQDACRGDSGGPLVVGDTQVGIIRRAKCEGGADTVILFANVGRFRQWLDDIMKDPPVVPP